MDEKRQKKLDHGSTLLDIYVKNKNPEVHGRSDYHSTSAETSYETSLMTSDKSVQESEKTLLKLDSPTLHKKTAQFDSLNKKIKHLQLELSEKSERINALEIQNDVLRKGNGDGVGMSPRDGDREMIRDLQKMVDARDTYIRQLSDSLQKRSEDHEASILREKELVEEIQNLQQLMNALTKQTEIKLSESYSERVENRAKVELMSSQIQEYTELVKSLRATMENNNKELATQKEALVAKEKKLEKYKSEASEDVKKLMRQVETINYDLSKKEKELAKSKNEVEVLRSQLEEQFGAEIVALKKKLENKYADDVKKVEILYDGMLLEHIRKSDDQLRAMQECSHLEDQIKSFKELYEKEIQKYKEELQTLLQKSKGTEEKLTYELEKYKQEADHYRQQVENLENKVAEEVRKIQRECFKELDSYESEMKREKNKYELDIQKLSKKLKDVAIIEATKEVELESYKNELEKLQQYTCTIEEKFDWTRGDFERQKSLFIAQMTENQNNESKLMNELRISRAKLLEYENTIYDLSENLKDQSSKFNEKYQNVARTFEEQIQNLMNELERTKAYYEGEKSRYTSVINEQENQIKNLEAKLNYLHIVKLNKTNESNMSAELFADQDSVEEHLEQIDVLKKNLMAAEKLEKSNTAILFKVLSQLKQVKTCINRILGNDTQEISQAVGTSHLENNAENIDHDNITKELEKTICDIMNMTQAVDPDSISEQSRISNVNTSTPKDNDSSDCLSDPSCIKDDPGNDLVRKCELLEAENIKLIRKLEILTAHMKEMEYCLYVASKESTLFDEKCKDLNSKITELETLKLSEFMLKKENNELKERLLYVEESEKNMRTELAGLVENNIKLEKVLNKSLVDLHQQVSNNGPNIKLEMVLQDLKTKSEEVVHLRSQLSTVQNLLKDNQEKMMQLKAQCDKFIAEHDFMMSEIKTKQKELEDVWKERNELATENKILQSKLLSGQGKSCLQVHKIPSSVRFSSTSLVSDKETEASKMPIPEGDDDFREFHLKRLQTMHLLTESIAMSSKTSLKDSSSNLSVASRIDLELKQLDEMFDDSSHCHMPTITEEDEISEFSEEERVFLEQMAQGDQNKDEKVDPK